MKVGGVSTNKIYLVKIVKNILRDFYWDKIVSKLDFFQQSVTEL